MRRDPPIVSPGMATIVAAYRRANGLSEEALAAIIGVKKSEVRRISRAGTAASMCYDKLLEIISEPWTVNYCVISSRPACYFRDFCANRYRHKIA